MNPDIVAALDRQSPNQLVAPVPALTPGTYTVHWTSVANDGDSLSGSYSFSLAAQTEDNGGTGIWWLVTAVSLAVILLTISFRQRKR